MIGKTLENITFADVQTLVENDVPEGRTLDYKRDLPGKTDEGKKEFLADVSSFANASGGDLILGVAQDKKANPALSIVGLPGMDPDADVLRLENMIRDGIEPRIPVVRPRIIPGPSGADLLVIQIQKSWISPHMVAFKDSSRFYSRNSRGKYQMDVTEIRSAFALSASLPEKIQRIRDERLSKITAGEMPRPLGDLPKIVLHMIPIAALDPATVFDPCRAERVAARIHPVLCRVTDWRFNADGFLTHGSTDPTCEWAYVQVFRNGLIESVQTELPVDDKQRINMLAVEKKILDAVSSYAALLREWDFATPVFVLLSVVGARGLSMRWDVPLILRNRANIPIDRDHLLLPDVILQDFDSRVEAILKPAFDAWWQACGWSGSRCYSGDRWVGGDPMA